MTPSTTRRLDYLVFTLTILAALPYELPESSIIPAGAKQWIVLIGLIAKLILSEFKNQQTAHKEDL